MAAGSLWDGGVVREDKTPPPPRYRLLYFPFLEEEATGGLGFPWDNGAVLEGIPPFYPIFPPRLSV